MRAALWEPPAPRVPVGMLSDRGVGVPDTIGRFRSAIHNTVARAVAEHIGAGGWCDAWAWADVGLFTRVGPTIDDDNGELELDE